MPFYVRLLLLCSTVFTLVYIPISSCYFGLDIGDTLERAGFRSERSHQIWILSGFETMSARFGQLNPYDLHKRLINEYVLKRAGDTALLGVRDASGDKTDADVLREHHRFLWDEHETAGTWEQQLARKYYDKLFKEYCLCDLSRYKENKVCDGPRCNDAIYVYSFCTSGQVALRWRTEREVIDGRGQFSCAHTKCTGRETTLRSWEVNFVYVEQTERKNALVKVRLCVTCSDMLNYRSKKREVKKLKRQARKSKREQRPARRSGADDGGDAAASSNSLDYNTAGDERQDSEESALNDAELKPRMTDDPQSEVQCWAKATTVEEKSREEEFDEYLEDLLL